jgi:hypothetical protein
LASSKKSASAVTNGLALPLPSKEPQYFQESLTDTMSQSVAPAAKPPVYPSPSKHCTYARMSPNGDPMANYESQSATRCPFAYQWQSLEPSPEPEKVQAFLEIIEGKDVNLDPTLQNYLESSANAPSTLQHDSIQALADSFGMLYTPEQL